MELGLFQGMQLELRKVLHVIKMLKLKITISITEIKDQCLCLPSCKLVLINMFLIFMNLHITGIKASNSMVTAIGFAIFLFTYSLPGILLKILIGIIILKSEFKNLFYPKIISLF